MTRHRRLPLRLRSGRRNGMTLVEVLVAVLIATSAIALLVPTLVRQYGLSSDTTSLTAVEAVVSRDLDWISDYARWWKMRAGPYSLPISITALSNPPTGNEVVYEPPASSCAAGTLTGEILTAMANAPSEAARPYTVPATAPQTTDLATVNGITVQRTITPQTNRLQLRYQLQGAPAASLRFSRQASVLIEAAAWCETLP